MRVRRWSVLLVVACACGRINFDVANDAGDGSDGDGGTGVAGDFCSQGGWCWEDPLPQGNILRGVWGTSATDVWAVGEAATLLHFDGSTWRRINFGTDVTNIESVWGSAPDDVWAAGNYGVIVHWDGSTWTMAT